MMEKFFDLLAYAALGCCTGQLITWVWRRIEVRRWTQKIRDEQQRQLRIVKAQGKDPRFLTDADTNWEELTKKFGIHEEYLKAREEEKQWKLPS